MKRIFVVEDELELLEVIKSYLENSGFSVTAFSDAYSAMSAVNDEADLWLLDIMLGTDISGYDIIKEINANNPKPVIFMSARDQEFDRILGLEMGSEDYITKPFSMREMVLRVNNVIKRNSKAGTDDIITYGKYTINKDKRIVLEGDTKIQLTSKELDLLIILIVNQGVSFTREKLLSEVWGDDYFGSARVVDDLVKRIRKKVPDINIETIYGYGYRLT